MEELEKLEKEIYGVKEPDEKDDNKDDSEEEEEEPVSLVYPSDSLQLNKSKMVNQTWKRRAYRF